MADDSPFIVFEDTFPAPLLGQVGGKALNLWRLSNEYSCNVPSWICVTSTAFQHFIKANKLQRVLQVDPSDLEKSCKHIQDSILSSPIPPNLEDDILSRISEEPLKGHFVAVRSSGTDEDSGAHSFAGQFESYLFQKGSEAVLLSLKRCWASCFSTRVMSHRLEVGLPLTSLNMAVIIQVMVSSESSGVAFSRHPLKPVSGNCVFIESVFGLGEGIVGGELEGDRIEVDRTEFTVTKEVVAKEEMMVQAEEGGVQKVGVAKGYEKEASISDSTAVEIAKLLVEFEKKMGSPQDFEWAVEGGVLYCLQTRPIVTLPPFCFYDYKTIGGQAILWDNSNIVESYSGVTSPLTFSFASRAYTEVYTLTLRVCHVPPTIIESYKPYIGNMLGLVRGNIYYNLMNWYRYVSCMPVGDSAKFMETMMGVKQTLEPELEAELGLIRDTAPKYSCITKLKVIHRMLHSIFFIDGMVEGFFGNFNKHYEDAVQRDFKKMSLVDQMQFVEHLFKDVLGRWDVPIINDAYVMLFFGLLKKLVRKYLVDDSEKAESLQNDLLCGQGNVESTEPTKMLMRIAEYVDTHSPQLREWFVSRKQEVLDMLGEEVERALARREGSAEPPLPNSDGLRQRRKGSGTTSDTDVKKDTPPDLLLQEKRNVIQAMRLFLARYGFRCINELKLEENTLHDDPGFLHEMISGYVRSKTYSISDMEAKEVEIRTSAEKTVLEKLKFHQRLSFNWVLFHARRGVRHRENMRFARTKLFGVFRSLFRGIGHNLTKLRQLDSQQDVFYLTLDEIAAYVDGRAVTTNLRALVELRKKEYEGYRKGLPPPERFLTKGACGINFEFPQLLDDLNLLKDLEMEAASDPNVLRGIPCCPGIVEGTVRVVSTVNETQGLNGEILVTARTDPGWVPLYPLCSGLIIERGSLLSHSAVVARELGLPTIVSVSGGLMKRLKTGMKVCMDAGKGTVTIVAEKD